MRSGSPSERLTMGCAGVVGLKLRPIDLLRFAHLSEQFFNGLFHRRSADVSVADDAFVIQDIDRRPGRNIPLRGDWAAGSPAVPEGSPCDILLLGRLLQPLFRVTVDTDQNKRLVREFFDERPLVWVHSPAGASPIAPEIDHHDFSAIVAQIEFHTVYVFSFDVGCQHANLQVFQFEDRRCGEFS